MGQLYSQSADVKNFKKSILAAIDTLEKESRVEAMIDLVYYYYDYVPDSAIFYADLAWAEAQSMAYAQGLISISAMKGSYYNDKGDYQKAKLHFEEALEENLLTKNVIRGAKIKDNLANVYISEGKYQRALDIKREVFEVFRLEKDSAAMYSSSTGIGNLFLKMDDTSGAMNFLKNALRFAREPREKAVSLGNLAIIYKQLGELDSAFFYYEASLEQGVDMPYFRMSTYQNMAIAYREIGNISKAKEYTDNAIAIAVSNQDDKFLTRLKILQAYNYLYENMPNQAEAIIQEIKGRITSTTGQTIKLDFYKLRWKVAKKRSAWQEAESFGTRYLTLKDSIQNLEVKKELKALQTKYEVVEKDRLISDQNLQLSEEAESKKRMLYWFLIIIIVTLLISWIVWSFQRSKMLLAEKDKLIQLEKIKQLEQEKKLIMFDSMVEGQEQERIRIAKDLHDSLGSLMSALKSHLAAIYKEIEKIETVHIDQEMDSIIDRAGRELRRIAYNMSPTTLANLGLKHSIEDLVVFYTNRGDTEINFQWLGDPLVYEENRDLMIYRVVQEILTNAYKHADAKTIKLQISILTDEIQLIYKDDGRGFDTTDEQKNKKGMGLKNMNSRVSYLSGNIEISSAMGKGSTIEIHVPLKQ